MQGQSFPGGAAKQRCKIRALPVGFSFFPAALNSFRDAKETAIETTTQFIGHSQLDSIDLYAAAGGIPMT